ncbi:ubiquitin thioesterase otubain-like [Sycon ciliatum]|uniref:ubiquitin thioesterase otubain-like n=1 Tax=Sycon ciliatum TaxID=27933 RepID=UPI0020A9C099|eukprot:scpid86246/ scgid27797/ Ubiquitin thioesterase OTUB1; Deubiquitinating enzyme OTUB1; OTU domain-containing ubiquitin aldehyde-binding protein 1; Otubain-1; Ubiquitin-specific-processing protease OTUB1
MATSEPASDIDISDHLQSVRKEATDGVSLVGECEDVEQLRADYSADDQVYQGKITSVVKDYKKMRRTRPDGNCFFRAFAFGYCETLLTKADECARVKVLVEERKQQAFALGFPEMTTEDFFDTFVSLLETIEGGMSERELIEYINNDSYSDYIVVTLRILASAELQANNDFFINFVQGFSNMTEYCKKEVEPMYLESDHLHITALTSSLKVPVRVVYMDRGEGGEVNWHDFQEDAGAPVIKLLYRPGHYDLLYDSA